ncbi:MAG: hypothetical protein AAF998_13175 [Bacteroidota bacterium]
MKENKAMNFNGNNPWDVGGAMHRQLPWVQESMDYGWNTGNAFFQPKTKEQVRREALLQLAVLAAVIAAPAVIGAAKAAGAKLGLGKAGGAATGAEAPGAALSQGSLPPGVAPGGLDKLAALGKAGLRVAGEALRPFADPQRGPALQAAAELGVAAVLRELAGEGRGSIAGPGGMESPQAGSVKLLERVVEKLEGRTDFRRLGDRAAREFARGSGEQTMAQLRQQVRVRQALVPVVMEVAEELGMEGVGNPNGDPTDGILETVTITPEDGPGRDFTTDERERESTFHERALENTLNFDPENPIKARHYKPIDGVHRYYIWFTKIADQQFPNIKFFHAAAEVTSMFNVGGLHWFSEYSLSGLSKDGMQTMEYINTELLKRNMEEIKKMLVHGRSDAVRGDGIIWDLNYVEYEQRRVDEIVESDRYRMTKYDKFITNQLFDLARTAGFAPLLMPIIGGAGAIQVKRHLKNRALEGAYQLAGRTKLDFENPSHRRMIGRSMVFMHHLQRPGFIQSEEFRAGVSYLVSEYGSVRTRNFLIGIEVLPDWSDIVLWL